MPRKPDTPCAGCGKLMHRTGKSLPPGQARCHECRRAARLRACAHCDRKFDPGDKAARNPTYCSRACCDQARRRTPPSRPCKQCGTLFAIDTKNNKQTYCSTTCAVDASRKPKVQASRIYIVDCGECGKAFIARRRDKRYCSAECFKEHFRRYDKQRYYGDHKRRDQLTAYQHARRADRLGIEASRDVTLSYLIERDKGRCQIPVCQFRSRKVAAIGTSKRNPRGPSIDHIIPLSQGGTHTLGNVQLAHLKCNRVKYNTGGGDQLRLIG